MSRRDFTHRHLGGNGGTESSRDEGNVPGTGGQTHDWSFSGTHSSSVLWERTETGLGDLGLRGPLKQRHDHGSRPEG